jgi:hypothetical protein
MPASQEKQSGRKNVDWKVLDILHPDAAGIDVGGNEHWVAVSPERDAEPVRRFGCFTADLREMAGWLTDKGVRSVAMQSTGVYWMPVLEVWERQGREVYLVNARHTKNLPGPQERRAGMSVAAEAAYLRPAESQFSADRRDPNRTRAVAATGQSGGRRQPRDPADAEGIDREERTTRQCADRDQRRQRHDHHRRDSEGRAQSLEFGGAGPAWGKGHPGGYRQEPGGEV